MCKDNLDKCGCGCNRCSNSTQNKSASTTPTKTMPTADSFAPSGYSKKVSAQTTMVNQGSGYSKKTTVPTMIKTAEKKSLVDETVHTPMVEVMPNDKLQKQDETKALVATGISLALLFLGAAIRDRSEQK